MISDLIVGALYVALQRRSTQDLHPREQSLSRSLKWACLKFLGSAETSRYWDFGGRPDITWAWAKSLLR